MFFSTLYVLQHVICSSVRYMFFSTLYVLQHVICSSVLYMFFRTLDVLQYVICSSARYMFFSKLYVLQHVICSSARYIFFSTLYGLLSLLKRAPNFSQYTELPRKDETSETIVRNLLSPFSCIQSSYRPKLYYFCKPLLVNHLNTQLNAKTKNQASNRHILLEFCPFGSSLQSHPLWIILYYCVPMKGGGAFDSAGNCFFIN